MSETDESDSHAPLTLLSQSRRILRGELQPLETEVTIRKTANSMKKALATGFAAMLLAGAVPVAAGAQVTSPACEQYSPSTGTFGGGGGSGSSNSNCQQGVDPDSGGGPSGLNSTIGSLPFTGFDVLSMAAVALAVTGLGLVLQRAVSKPREEL
jgi:hypothetical protein